MPTIYINRISVSLLTTEDYPFFNHVAGKILRTVKPMTVTLEKWLTAIYIYTGFLSIQLDIEFVQRLLFPHSIAMKMLTDSISLAFIFPSSLERTY